MKPICSKQCLAAIFIASVGFLGSLAAEIGYAIDPMGNVVNAPPGSAEVGGFMSPDGRNFAGGYRPAGAPQGTFEAFVSIDGNFRNLNPPLQSEENFGIRSINNTGAVAGERGGVAGGQRFDIAVLLTPDGTVTDAGDIGDDGEVNALNDAGQIVGESNDGAFLWTPGGQLEILPGLGGAISSRARDINNLGWIVGEGDASPTEPRNAPILWVPGESPVRIGGDGFFGRGTAINDTGGFIGESGDEVFFGRGTDLWQGFGHVTEVFNGNLVDITDRVITGGINDADQVVGTTFADPIQGTPFAEAWLWTEDGGTVLLDELIDPALGIDIFRALDINNRGEILVDTSEGFALLTPIPEPSTGVLLMLALAAAGVYHRSRKARRD